MSASTDRELLELAAKAAGFDHVSQHADGLWYVHDQTCEKVERWNPLTDDGDALRLAVKLNLRVDCYDQQVECMDGCDPYKIGEEEYTNTFVCIEYPARDKEQDTRRAIVRAAARLGALQPNHESPANSKPGCTGEDQ